MKINFSTIWIGYGNPEIYQESILSFTENALSPQDYLYVFTDSQIKLNEKSSAEIQSIFKKLSSEPRIKIIDIQNIPSIRDNAYYKWIIENTNPKHLAGASDCLRFLIVDYLLQTQPDYQALFFEADVRYELKVKLKDIEFIPLIKQHLVFNSEGRTHIRIYDFFDEKDLKNISIAKSNKIIIFNEPSLENNDVLLYAMYFPNTVSTQQAVKHVCLTYQNIGKYVLEPNLWVIGSSWDETSSVEFNYLHNLLYKEGWSVPLSTPVEFTNPEYLPKYIKNMLPFEPQDCSPEDIQKIVSLYQKAQFTNIYGVELPLKVTAFVSSSVRAEIKLAENKQPFFHHANANWHLERKHTDEVENSYSEQSQRESYTYFPYPYEGPQRQQNIVFFSEADKNNSTKEEFSTSTPIANEGDIKKQLSSPRGQL